MWKKYSCDKCNNFPLLSVLANHKDSKSAFENWIKNKGGAICAAVWRDDGGKALTEACGNGGWGGTSFFIKPDKSFKKYSSSDISDNGIKEHQCGGPDNIPPVVTIESPTNGAILEVGTNYKITWKATDNVGVVSRKILFSKNNGSTWSPVDSAGGNSGTYEWQVPDAVSQTCKIQISAYDAAGNVGRKESAQFEIEPGSGINYLPMVSDNTIRVRNLVGVYEIYLPLTQGYRVEITNLQGQRLSTITASGKAQWHVIPNGVSSGVHFISIYTDRELMVKQLRLVK